MKTRDGRQLAAAVATVAWMTRKGHSSEDLQDRKDLAVPREGPMAAGLGELKWAGAPTMPTPARGPHSPDLHTHPHWLHRRLPRRILISPSCHSASQKWPAPASWPTGRSSVLLPRPPTDAGGAFCPDATHPLWATCPAYPVNFVKSARTSFCSAQTSHRFSN